MCAFTGTANIVCGSYITRRGDRNCVDESSQLVVLFRNSQIQSLGHTASPGNTLHFTVLEGDGVEKRRR
jgi:hypothetical protein